LSFRSRRGARAGESLRADQAFQRFLPLFVDLDGWQGKKPDGILPRRECAALRRRLTPH
jgi:hypothetical protein